MFVERNEGVPSGRQRPEAGAGCCGIFVIWLKVGNKILLPFCYWITIARGETTLFAFLFRGDATETLADLRQRRCARLETLLGDGFSR